VKLHEKYMSRCLDLAKNGLGTTYPNPLVGSVIVHKDRIIGEGWHYKAGQPHAEVNAITSVSNSALLKDATIYVNLEPCSHHGKTPPCANLIIEKGIQKVVIGTVDPNPKVAGQGIQKLKEAGCEVVVGVLEEECRELNKRFFTFQTKKRPYIFLKWAQTADGFIAPTQRDKQQPVWITSDYSRQLVHKQRAEEQAIIVGTNTVIEDNPSLTTRNWNGNSPLRIVVDRSLRIPKGASVYDKSVPTLFFTEKRIERQPNLLFEQIDFSENIIPQICDSLYKQGLQSLIVEGGTRLLQSFIDSNLWDEALAFSGKIAFGEGVKAPNINGRLLSEKTIETDMLKHYKNSSL
jgi:diaminohydroxyphosphoribosylaminopyrimidine deaminase/5-amino-6-(5-phosphoribosylamino)uracil reductase